jgi:uncharacterized protein with HEPN domain
MRDACREIMGFTAGLDRAAYDADRKLQLAIIALIQIVGEAAIRVSTELQKANP